jgi:hypothetical protein
MSYRLGRKALKTDSRTLRLAKYMKTLAPAPPAVNWAKGITNFGMMLNDNLGCCTIAGVGHAIQIWTANASSEQTIPDSIIQNYYSTWDGYVPGDPSTDNGGVELDVLSDWKAHGFSGHLLTAYADPAVSSLAEVKQAINLFLGLYIGLSVTDQVMENDNDPTIPWDVTPGDTIDGGHCVYVIGYDAQFIYFVSWGQIYKMTTQYWTTYVDEAHALMSPDLLSSSGLSASGFNSAQLLADLAAIH